MKENKEDKCDYNGVFGLIIILTLIFLIGGGITVTNNLNDYKQSDEFYQEYSNYWEKQSSQCERHLQDCNTYLERFEKNTANLNNQLLLVKENCPICPTDEVCIKLVKENKFQCINRELIGGN